MSQVIKDPINTSWGSIVPGEFYLDNFGDINYVNKNEKGEFTYCFKSHPSPLPLTINVVNSFVDHFRDPALKVDFVLSILKESKDQGGLESSAQSSPKWTEKEDYWWLYGDNP